MNGLYQRFVSGIRWTTFEIFSYQGILLIHQFFLARVLGASTYGVTGAAFAALYFSIAFFNFGLDLSWKPFFTTAMKHKIAFKRVVFGQLAVNLMALTLFPPAVYLCITTFFDHVLRNSFLLSHITRPTLFLLWMLCITEGIKRSLKYFLYTAFYNKTLALAEGLGIIGYVLIVWGLYGGGYDLTLFVLFFPLLLISLFLTTYYFSRCWLVYTQLPTVQSQSSINRLGRDLFLARIFNYGNQLFALLYSSNLWIPVFAFFFGPVHAGVLTLTSHIAYTISVMFRKIFGVSSGALLSHAKDLSPEAKRSFFGQTTRVLYYSLMSFMLIALVGRTYFVRFLFPHSLSIEWIPLILFFTIHFSENFLITCQEFFTVEDRPHHFLAFTLFNSILLYLIIMRFWSTSPGMTVAIITVVRLLTISMITFYVSRRWGIKLKHFFSRSSGPS